MADQSVITSNKNQGDTQLSQNLNLAGKTQDIIQEKGNIYTRFIDGAVSGLISGAILQPLQVIKTSMQISPIDKPTDHHHQSKAFKKIMSHTKHKHYDLLSFKEATMLIFEREGIKGYYRGFLPSIIKNTMNSGTYFSTLYYLRIMFQKTNLMSDNWVNFWSSAIARGIQSVLSNPLIVIKTRLEVLGFQEYNSLYDAVTKIIQNEGYRGFFTGLKISLIRDVPFSGIFYPIYEFCKKFYSSLLMFDQRDELQRNRAFYLTLVSSLSSVTANFGSCIITHPLDIIRTRVFFQFYNKDQSQHYQSLTSAIIKIYEHDGLIGYFRGITPRIMRKGLGNILAWGIYEYLVDKREGRQLNIE